MSLSEFQIEELKIDILSETDEKTKAHNFENQSLKNSSTQISNIDISSIMQQDLNQSTVNLISENNDLLKKLLNDNLELRNFVENDITKTINDCGFEIKEKVIVETNINKTTSNHSDITKLIDYDFIKKKLFESRIGLDNSKVKTSKRVLKITINLKRKYNK